MTKREKEKLIKDLANNIANAVIEKIDDIPEEWDGLELRELVADKARYYSRYFSGNKKRYKNYKNEVLVRNL